MKHLLASPDFDKWWPCNAHVIGKDIMVPAHMVVYWPIMLHAMGIEDAQMPKLLVHGWWNIAGAKMSKSEGNIIDPAALAEKYGSEAVRYYLLRDIATGRDADFSEDRLRLRYNSDLAQRPRQFAQPLAQYVGPLQRWSGGCR